MHRLICFARSILICEFYVGQKKLQNYNSKQVQVMRNEQLYNVCSGCRLGFVTLSTDT